MTVAPRPAKTPTIPSCSLFALLLLIPVAAPVAAPVANAAPISIWAIGSDPANFVPDQLTLANVPAQTVTSVATLADGSLGFNGGLTFGPNGNLYAIANDSSGASSLYQVRPTGALSLAGAPGGLGFGFYGGLTFDPLNGLFYAAADDPAGNSSLYSITPAGVSTSLGQTLGTGYSGLAFDTASGVFYGIGNDSSGLSTLYRFPLGGSAAPVATLGFGFGGLTYDAGADTFWAIAPVSNAASQLFQISPGGVESDPNLTLGDGFVELAVAAPEPATWLGTFSGLFMAAALLKSRRKL